MQKNELGLPGCYLLRARVSADRRGFFVKTFQEQMFRGLGLATHFAEEYHSVSRKNVLRGLHFQVPPHDHTKIVYCLKGRALDVVVDLRRASPSFGQWRSALLTEEGGEIIYLPSGVAHGFLALDDDVVMQYKVTTEYAPEHDQGILWSSVGFDWPVADPIISDRDQSFPGLTEFHSPF